MDFIETRAYELLCHWLSSWPGGKRMAVLLGRPGSGKTVTLRRCASRMGYRVYEPGSPEEALRAAPRRGLERMLIHLDRPYRMGFNNKLLRRLVSSSASPVVVEDEPESRRFYEPLAPAIIDVEPPRRLPGLAGGLRGPVEVRGDIRQIILAGEYGSTPIQPGDWEAPIRRWISRGDAGGLSREHLPSLLDTALSYCHGLSCYELVSLLVAADISGRPDVLHGLGPRRPSARVSHRFYRRLRAMRESGAEPG